MSRDAYYFSHDSNAQHDEKILQLRAKFKWEGYGIYWAVIERLRDCEGYKFPLIAIPGLAISLSLAQARLEAWLEHCYQVGLFLKNGDFFYSESLLRRMAKSDEKRAILREAGRRGGIASSQAQARLKPPSSHPQARKESKVKESISLSFSLLERFNELFLKYPNKDGKKRAKVYFLAQVKTEQDWLDIQKALQNYQKHLEITKTEPKYIKSAATWFNNWRDWVDWVEPGKIETPLLKRPL